MQNLITHSNYQQTFPNLANNQESMKNNYLLHTIVIFLLSCAATSWVVGQNISLEIDGDNLYYDESGCSDCYSTPDPDWYVRLQVNAVNYDWNVHREDTNCGWQGTTNYSYYGPNTVTYSTSATMQLNGAEIDGGLCGGDDNVCGGYSTVNTVTPSASPPCQWNYYTGTRTCGGGDYRIYWSAYWQYLFSPTLSGESPTNQLRCQGSSPATLNATVNTDANGRPLARWYKWQIANTPTGVWQDIPGTQNATANTSFTNFTYTPYQISGTRYYRFVATSNCSADFSSYTTVSATYTVTYAFVAAGAYTTAPGGFPYGTGDGAPAIISGVCGGTVLPSQSVTFNTLQSPNAGAVVNATGYAWSASGGTPTTGTGSSFAWTAPATPGSYATSVTYNFGCSTPATVACAVTVGSPNCSFAYVAPGGSNTITSGGPNNPYATISYAISQLAGRTHIKVASGTITETAIIDIPNAVIIEGGYSVSGGVWTKSSAVTTTVSCSGTQVVNTDVEHVMGFRSNNTSNWTLQDLTITTVAASGFTGSGNGKSNYGVYIANGSANYEIIRCNITSGAGSTGNTGANGSTGGNGSTGNLGSNGNCDCYSGCTPCAGGSGGGSQTSVGAGGAGAGVRARLQGPATCGAERRPCAHKLRAAMGTEVGQFSSPCLRARRGGRQKPGQPWRCSFQMSAALW